MAEALAAVGVAASLVQLTDVSIRTCLCLYAFFSTLHNSQPEFHRHIIVIRDIHDAIQLIRKTVSCQRLDEAEGKALSSQLSNLTQELSSLEKATAGKDPTRLRAKIAWALKSAETDRALQRLENHKTTLVLLLQAFNLGQSGRVLHSQTSTQAHLQSLMEQQKRDGTTMRSEVGKGMEDLANRMGTLDSAFGYYQQSLNAGFSSMSREIQVSEEHLGNTLRHELQRQLRPLVDEVLTKSEIQNAATLEQFRAIVHDAATRIERNVARKGGRDKQRPTSSMRDSAELKQHSQHLMMARSVMHKQKADSLDSAPTGLAHVSRTRRPTVVDEFSHRACIPLVGTFRVEYRTHTEPTRRFYTFKIDFWPSNMLLRRIGFSLKYSSRPDGQGYTALSPSMAVRPIISTHDPIWRMIENDDINAIIARFRDFKNGLFDQNDHGGSLLMCATSSGSYRVTQLLLGQGADPTQTNVCGRDSLTALLDYQISASLIGYCRGPVETDFESFAAALHSLVAVGCDLEECTVTIFEFLRDPSFRYIPFNLQQENDAQDDPKDPTDKFDSEISDHQSQGTGKEDRDSDQLDDNEHLCHRLSLNTDQDRYLADIRRLAEFLNRQGLDLLQTYDSLVAPNIWASAPRMTLPVLRQCGLDSNYSNTHGKHMKPIIYTVMWAVLNDKLNHNLMDNLVSLISTGADIYTMEWASGDWVEDVEDGVMSPTAFASATDMVVLWERALRRAGYDPEEVFAEDERRRREFRLLNGANSSSVEVPGATSGPSVRRRRI
ncbi:hypothetical protein ACHAPT_009487 [Fusarium lateritium]